VDYISRHDDSDLIEDKETSDPTCLARDVLASFNVAIPLHSLEACILLHRKALPGLPVPRSECSLSLSVTLMFRFHHTSQQGDLDEAISLFGDLDPSSEMKYDSTGVLARTSATFLTKFIVTGSEGCRELAFKWHDLLQVRAAE
jgi:hypothetical protein